MEGKYAHHDDNPEQNHSHVEHVGSLRSVAKRQDETREQDGSVNPLEDSSKNFSNVSKQIISTEGCRQDAENQVEVTNGEPGEDHADSLVDKLNRESDLSEEAVIRAEQLIPMRNRVNGSEEGSVQPSSSLQDQLGHGVWHVGLSSSGLDVLQNPVTLALRNKLETQDTILSKVHVGGENTRIGSVHLLSSKVLLQWSLAELIVLQSDVTVCREGTWKHRNESECGLKRLVENVGHLILEVLGGDERVEKVLASRSQHGLNFSTSSCTVWLEVKSPPQLVDGVLSWSGTGIDKNAYVWIQNTAEGLEEPSV